MVMIDYDVMFGSRVDKTIKEYLELMMMTTSGVDKSFLGNY